MGPDRVTPGEATTEATIARLEQRALRRSARLEGVGLLLLGSLALIFPLVASVWLTAVLALVFVVAGLVGWLTTWARARHLSGPHAFWRFAVATLLLLAGIWMVSRLTSGPVAAARPVAALVLTIGVVFLLEGIEASLVSLSHRHLQGWGWGLINGLVTLGLGAGILTVPASRRAWLLGGLLGISFVFSGLDLLGFRIRFHGLANDGPWGGTGSD